MTDTTPCRRPKGRDMQAAIAFITALERGDHEGSEEIWGDAAEQGRGYMLCLALARYARTPEKMAQVLSGDLPTRLVKLANVTAMIAAMSDDTEDDE